TRMGRGIAGVDLDGAGELALRDVEGGARLRVEVLPPAQEALVRRDLDLGSTERLPLLGAEHSLECGADAGRDLVLDLEHLLERALEAVRPARRPAGHVHQPERAREPG